MAVSVFIFTVCRIFLFCLVLVIGYMFLCFFLCLFFFSLIVYYKLSKFLNLIGHQQRYVLVIVQFCASCLSNWTVQSPSSSL